MTVDGFIALRWRDDGLPLIAPPFPSPILADPSFLFPSEAPDGQWQLFAHTAFGIRRYTSAEGLDWRDRGISFRSAMRGFVRKIGGEYLLAYEARRPFSLVAQVLPRRPRWRSRLELRRSADLKRWSSPEILLEPEMGWGREESLGESVSNPCLVDLGGGWRLWFSASLVTVPDCGFDEPKFIGFAEGPSPGGPFVPEAVPRLDPARDLQPGVLGSGSMKVLRLDDGWVGLQNKIYHGPGGGSRSAIFVLRSADGREFTPASSEPLLAPSTGWRASHVYACDCRIDPKDGNAYLYYNARDGWYKTEGRERIGRLVGRT